MSKKVEGVTAVVQLAISMLLVFLSYGVISSFRPYADEEDNTLGLLCQVEIFVLLIGAMIANQDPTNGLVDYLMTGLIFIIITWALATEGELLDGWAEYLGYGEEPEVRPSRREFIKPALRAIIDSVLKVIGFFLRGLDKAGGVQDQDEVRQQTRRQRAEKHPELGRRHRISSWKNSNTFKEGEFAGLEEEVDGEGGNHVEKIDRLTRRGGDDEDDNYLSSSALGKGKGKFSGNVDINAFLHPESAGITLTLGDLRRSASKSAQGTAKSLAALMRAIKSSMEASLSEQAANWPLLTPRGQHLTNPYKADISHVEACAMLDESAAEVFEAQHELRGIAFLAGGGATQDAMSSLGVSRPQNAQEWKELVSLSVQTTMATAKSLRVLKRVLASLPVDEDDTDIAGMRAAQLAGAFGGLISELGVSANATATTLRGLLSLAVAAGAAARFAPWHVSPDGDSLSGTDRSPASTPQSSGRGNAKANRPGASGRRLTLDERLAAAQKKQQAGPLVPSFPETLSNPRPLPLERVDTLEERPSWREPGSDRGSEDLSTPAKLRSGSPVGHRSNTHGEDAESEESSKDSPESAKARRARLQQMRSFSTPGLGDILKGQDETTPAESAGKGQDAPTSTPTDLRSSKKASFTMPSDEDFAASKPAPSSHFPRLLKMGSTKDHGKSLPKEQPLAPPMNESPPAPLSSGDKKDKRSRSVLKV